MAIVHICIQSWVCIDRCRSINDLMVCSFLRFDCICLMGELGFILHLIALFNSIARPERQRWEAHDNNYCDWLRQTAGFMPLLPCTNSHFCDRGSLGRYIITGCCLLCDQFRAVSTHWGRFNTSSNRSFAHLSNRLG
jgi:hypothetical protein